MKIIHYQKHKKLKQIYGNWMKGKLRTNNWKMMKKWYLKIVFLYIKKYDLRKMEKKLKLSIKFKVTISNDMKS